MPAFSFPRSGQKCIRFDFIKHLLFTSVYIILENMLCTEVISILETLLLGLFNADYLELKCLRKSFLTLFRR